MRQNRQHRQTLTSGRGVSDVTQPTCVVTSAASGATAAAFTCTCTFSEVVTGFTADDISVTNGSAAAVGGSGAVYTSVITPTATGTVAVSVGAGVCADAAGNTNAASNTFSILYVGAALWLDFSATTGLYQTDDISTPVTADGQTIGYVTDKSGAGINGSQATAGLRPLYKTGIKNSLSAALFDASDDSLWHSYGGRSSRDIGTAGPVEPWAIQTRKPSGRCRGEPGHPGGGLRRTPLPRLPRQRARPLSHSQSSSHGCAMILMVIHSRTMCSSERRIPPPRKSVQT